MTQEDILEILWNSLPEWRKEQLRRQDDYEVVNGEIVEKEVNP